MLPVEWALPCVGITLSTWKKSWLCTLQNLKRWKASTCGLLFSFSTGCFSQSHFQCVCEGCCTGGGDNESFLLIRSFACGSSNHILWGPAYSCMLPFVVSSCCGTAKVVPCRKERWVQCQSVMSSGPECQRWAAGCSGAWHCETCRLSTTVTNKGKTIVGFFSAGA